MHIECVHYTGFHNILFAYLVYRTRFQFTFRSYFVTGSKFSNRVTNSENPHFVIAAKQIVIRYSYTSSTLTPLFSKICKISSKLSWSGASIVTNGVPIVQVFAFCVFTKLVEFEIKEFIIRIFCVNIVFIIVSLMYEIFFNFQRYFGNIFWGSPKFFIAH